MKPTANTLKAFAPGCVHWLDAKRTQGLVGFLPEEPARAGEGRILASHSANACRGQSTEHFTSGGRSAPRRKFRAKPPAHVQRCPSRHTGRHTGRLTIVLRLRTTPNWPSTTRPMEAHPADVSRLHDVARHEDVARPSPYVGLDGRWTPKAKRSPESQALTAFKIPGRTSTVSLFPRLSLVAPDMHTPWPH